MSEWRLAMALEYEHPLIHDGTGRNDDPTTAARMFYMSWDKNDIARCLEYLNNLEQYKALADRFAGEARAVFESELEEDSDDALRRGVSGVLADYDALKAQEAGQ